MAPRRKPLLDLEAEFQGDVDDLPRQSRSFSSGAKADAPGKQIRGDSAPPRQPAPTAKKEKEFAWMDSDDDELDVGKDGATEARRREKRARTSRSRSPSEGPPLPASVSEIDTFAQMVRMTEKLKARVHTMAPAELVQCIAAAARVKFYDGSFIQDLLIPRVRRQLGDSRRKVPFTTADLVTMLCSLADLNCFDKSIFAGTVRELASRRSGEIDSETRTRLLGAFKTVKYECDEDRDFLEWLQVTQKAQRYEAMVEEQRMIVGNSKSGAGMHAPEGYLRSFMVGTTSKGVEIKRPNGLVS